MRCENCDDTGHVCENHTDKPWMGLSPRDDACNCGAGAPCPECAPEDDTLAWMMAKLAEQGG